MKEFQGGMECLTGKSMIFTSGPLIIDCLCPPCYDLQWYYRLFFQGLQVISEHASLRGDPSDESQPFDIREVDIFHPKYLPSSQMIQLLVDTVEVTEGTIQQNAVAALTEVCIIIIVMSPSQNKPSYYYNCLRSDELG